MDTLLGYLEAFALPLEDPLINEWVCIEDSALLELGLRGNFFRVDS